MEIAKGSASPSADERAATLLFNETPITEAHERLVAAGIAELRPRHWTLQQYQDWLGRNVSIAWARASVHPCMEMWQRVHLASTASLTVDFFANYGGGMVGACPHCGTETVGSIAGGVVRGGICCGQPLPLSSYLKADEVAELLGGFGNEHTGVFLTSLFLSLNDLLNEALGTE